MRGMIALKSQSSDFEATTEQVDVDAVVDITLLLAL